MQETSAFVLKRLPSSHRQGCKVCEGAEGGNEASVAAYSMPHYAPVPRLPKTCPFARRAATTCSRLPITLHSTGLPWGRRENPYHLPQHAILHRLTQSSPAHVAFHVLCSLRLKELLFPPSPARPLPERACCLSTAQLQ